MKDLPIIRKLTQTLQQKNDRMWNNFSFEYLFKTGELKVYEGKQLTKAVVPQSF